MAIALSRFCIFGLHNKYDIDIPIKDNKLILVGVNGLGKTTVVSILYFLLTEQWNRLFEFEFSGIAVEIGGAFIKIPRSDLDGIDDMREQFERLQRGTPQGRSIIPPRYAMKLFSHNRFPELLDLRSEKNETFTDLVEVIANDIGVPSTVITRVLRDLPKGTQGDLFAYPPSVREFRDALRSSGDYQVIYLPTYRRIEQDLKAIFPDLEERQIRELTSRNNTPPYIPTGPRSHVELVQFGMHDVEGKIEEELKEISQSARSQLSNLTASYLRDVIRNSADSFDPDLLSSLDSKTIRAVLSKVDENTLDANDKRELEIAIQKIGDNQSFVSERDKYLAHFFSRLFEIYNNLSQSEKNIQRLVEICNKYLQGKRLRYNDNEYTVRIIDNEESSINWRSLSSGEKQVASLFTHLFLSKEKTQLVVIDEPELSLSVPWQRTLLPHISKSGNCSLLVAVTHSPFIYENELDCYAIDLAKCTRPTVAEVN